MISRSKDMCESTNRNKFHAISLFSGAMGFDLGLERAGFEITVAVECDKYALETIKHNRPDLPVINSRIEDVTTEEILETAGLNPGDPALVVGGPSCQAFSTAGRRGSLSDPRGTMFEQFARVVQEIQPHFFVMENVRGLLSAAVKHRPLSHRGPGFPPLLPVEELGSAFQVVSQRLSELDYYTIFDVLNAADYGVPQCRQRLVIIGSREGKEIFMPTPDYSKSGDDGLPPWRSLNDALEGLKEEEPEFHRFYPVIEKYIKTVPEGGNWRDIPPKLREEAMGKAYLSWGGRTGFFRRLAWDRPSPALTTRPDSKGMTFCHPTELRPLSVREYARIQQFPDDWEFLGTTKKKYEQIGNAVPLGLGEAIGEAILKSMRSDKKRGRTGVVECWNIDFIARLSKRPKTIVNPPRMRKDSEEETISDWYKNGSRTRNEVLDYIAPELSNDLRKFVGKTGRKIIDDKGKTQHSRSVQEAKSCQNY